MKNNAGALGCLTRKLERERETLKKGKRSIPPRTRRDQHFPAPSLTFLPSARFTSASSSLYTQFTTFAEEKVTIAMLIALIGPPGAGKASVAHYLATQHGFRLLTLSSSSSSSHSALGSSENTTVLPSSKVMLDYVTDRWDQPFVTLDLNTVVDLEAFIKRPFFLCVEVGAAVLLRWKRFNAKHRGEKGRGGGGEVGLEEFVGLDDEVLYGYSGGSASSVMNGVEGIEGGKDGEAMTSTLSSSSLIGGNGIVDNTASIALSTHPSSSSSSSSSTPAPSSTTHNGLSSLRRYIHLSILNNFPTLPPSTLTLPNSTSPPTNAFAHVGTRTSCDSATSPPCVPTA